MGSDIELVNACMRGDPAAQSALIDEFQGPVFNAAYRILGNTHDAQDVAQTVFLKVFEHLSDFNPEHRLFSWVYRIAINESINASKRARPQGEYFDELHADQEQFLNEPSVYKSAEQALDRKKLAKELDAALNELSQEYRVVIVLKHIGGYSYQEISELVNVPEKTVRSRLYSARQRLQVILAGQAEQSFN